MPASQQQAACSQWIFNIACNLELRNIKQELRGTQAGAHLAHAAGEEQHGLAVLQQLEEVAAAHLDRAKGGHQALEAARVLAALLRGLRARQRRHLALCGERSFLDANPRSSAFSVYNSSGMIVSQVVSVHKRHLGSQFRKQVMRAAQGGHLEDGGVREAARQDAALAHDLLHKNAQVQRESLQQPG